MKTVALNEGHHVVFQREEVVGTHCQIPILADGAGEEIRKTFSSWARVGGVGEAGAGGARRVRDGAAVESGTQEPARGAGCYSGRD
jgi:hypothetical protein